jgi:tetratricopeptide (TPR) repeat protein
LLEAKLQAERQMEKSPASPYWHQIAGRIAIQEYQPQQAIEYFSYARSMDPKLDRIDFDLATAYFEQAEMTGNVEGYSQAAEKFSDALNASKKLKAETLFNRAQCYQRLHLFRPAVDDLTEMLKSAPDSAWAAEAGHQLRLLEANPAPVTNWAVPVSPEEYLRISAASPKASEAEFERYLQSASSAWIGDPSRESVDALARLASIGIAHNDRCSRICCLTHYPAFQSATVFLRIGILVPPLRPI